MPQLPTAEPQTLGYVLATLVAVAALVVIGRAGKYVFTVLRRHRRAAASQPSERLELDKLAPTGPPSNGPQLRIHNVPVRLAALVIAPVGRGSEVPAADHLPSVIDQIVPGLYTIVAAHGTRIVLWPPQLSTPGFVQALFSELRLPGNRGKGTPWCGVAGRFTANGRALLAGIALRAGAPNNLAQITLNDESQWLEVLRIDR